MRKIIYALSIFLVMPFVSESQTLQTREVIDNLTTPWEIIWGPDNWIWFTEKLNGQISRVNPETGERIVLTDITEVTNSVQESGLLGMAIHPDFANTPHVYAAYNYTNGTSFLKVVRLTYDVAGDTLINPMPIIDDIPTGGNHHGCRLLILGDKLFITTGDAGTGSNSQDNTSLNGKMLRLNLDGSIPSDNPIPGNALWTKGHRNAQGLIFVPQHNKMYTSEHGGTDELNIIVGGGRNYAWPMGSGVCLTGDCIDSNVVQPLLPNMASFNPIAGAPSGIEFYDHPAIPEWQNSLLVTELSSEELVVAQLNAAGDSVVSAESYYTNTYGRLRDVCVSPDGRVFISTSNYDQNVGSPGPNDDRIIEIRNLETFGLEENKAAIRWEAFPNPSAGSVTLKWESPADPIEWVTVNNVLGETIATYAVNPSQTTMNVSIASQGVYYITLSSQQAIHTKQVLIIK